MEWSVARYTRRWTEIKHSIRRAPARSDDTTRMRSIPIQRPEREERAVRAGLVDGAGEGGAGEEAPAVGADVRVGVAHRVGRVGGEEGRGGGAVGEAEALADGPLAVLQRVAAPGARR